MVHMRITNRAHALAQTELGYCLFCGAGPYVNVAIHTAKVHQVDVFQLRELLGVSVSHKFASPESRAKMAASYDKERGAALRAARVRGEKVWAPARRTAAGRETNTRSIVAYNKIAWAIRHQLAAGQHEPPF